MDNIVKNFNAINHKKGIKKMMKRRKLETVVFNKIRFYREVDETSPTNRNILNAGEKFQEIFKQLKKNTDKIKLSDFLNELYRSYGLEYSKYKISTLVNGEDYITNVERSEGSYKYPYDHLSLYIFSYNSHSGFIAQEILNDISELDKIDFDILAKTEFNRGDILINTSGGNRAPLYGRYRVVVYNDTNIIIEEVCNGNDHLSMVLRDIIKNLGNSKDREFEKDIYNRYHFNDDRANACIDYIEKSMGGRYKRNRMKLSVQEFKNSID